MGMFKAALAAALLVTGCVQAQISAITIREVTGEFDPGKRTEIWRSAAFELHARGHRLRMVDEGASLLCTEPTRSSDKGEAAYGFNQFEEIVSVGFSAAGRMVLRTHRVYQMASDKIDDRDTFADAVLVSLAQSFGVAAAAPPPRKKKDRTKSNVD